MLIMRGVYIGIFISARCDKVGGDVSRTTTRLKQEQSITAQSPGPSKTGEGHAASRYRLRCLLTPTTLKQFCINQTETLGFSQFFKIIINVLVYTLSASIEYLCY